MMRLSDVCVCPVRQFNVQLYVEKVFIAQKTSEDRGGKVKEAGERCGVIRRLTGEEFGGEGGVEGRKKGDGIYAVAKAHRQTG